jgi:hypothetical protein
MLSAAVMVVLITGCTPDARPAPRETAGPTQVIAGASPRQSDGGTVTALPDLQHARAAHTATRLPDGRVLVIGGCTTSGCGGTPLGIRAEVFDPRTRSFAAGPALAQARVGHTATGLADGRVLVVGGWPDEGRPPMATAEIYDPQSGRFAPAGSMAVARGGHTASRLADGRVLIVGGQDGSAILATAEIFDPSSMRFVAAARLPGPRDAHAAAVLRDGRVLVAGGRSGRETLLDSALLYDPARDSWTDAGRLHEAKHKLALAPLPDGGALVVGGQTRDARDARLSTTELFDARTLSFRPGPAMAEPRYKISEAVAALADGRVLIGGGGSTVEIYADGRLALLAGRLGAERQFPTATALADGSVLITGGYDNATNPTAQAFLAVPAPT